MFSKLWLVCNQTFLRVDPLKLFIMPINGATMSMTNNVYDKLQLIVLLKNQSADIVRHILVMKVLTTSLKWAEVVIYFPGTYLRLPT